MSSLTVLPTNPVYRAFFLRAVSHASSLGADVGECFAALHEASEGGIDATRWHKAWTKQADRLERHATNLLASSPPQQHSAKLAYLRASNYYRTAFLPLFGHPLDKEKVMPAYVSMHKSFEKAATLFDPPFTSLQIPFEQSSLRGYLCNPGHEAPRNDRLMILIGGYDAPLEEMFHWWGYHSLQRGYSVFIFDGPGQGGTLLEQGITMSHTYDEVLEAILKALSGYGKWKHVVVQGLSLGGLLCLKAVGGRNNQDHIDALVADPPSFGMLTAFRNRLPFPESVASQLPEGPAWAVPILSFILNRMQMSASAVGWTFRRGMLVHGCETPLDLVRTFASFDNQPYMEQITIPTLLTQAENDDLAKQAGAVFESLVNCSTKKLVHFAGEDGAGDHCEMGARQFFSETVFAWLDEVLDVNKSKTPM